MNNIVGLDIGGTKINGVVVSGKTILQELTVATPKSWPEFKVAIKAMVKQLNAGYKIFAVGVGIPGAINNHGKVLYAPNLPYLVNRNLLGFLQTLSVKKISIENDANCFALAEAYLGQGQGLKNFIGITLGTGIGGGLISNGQLYVGLHGSACEVGHMMADERNTYEELFQIYREQNNYSALGKLLGRLWADIYNLIDVEAIILGGSVTKSANQFLAYALAESQQRILNKRIRPKIIISKLNNAGSLGAALLPL